MASDERLLDRAASALDQILGQLLELGARQRQVQVLGPGGVGRYERQVDLSLGRRRQLDLRALGGFVQALERLRIVAQVDSLIALELVGEPVHHPLVEVIATQVSISAGRPHLDHTVPDLQQRDVERPATEVEHEDRLLALLVHSVGQRGGGRLVDDSQNLEAGDLAGVLGCLTLRVVEVGRDGDHGLGNPLAEELGGVLRQLPQHQGRDLLRRVLLAADLEPHRVVRSLDDLVGDDLRLFVDLAPSTTDEPFRRIDGRLRIENRLAPGDLTHQPLTVLGERDDRRRDPPAFGVGDDLGLPALHRRGHDRVRRAQIDANCLGHISSSRVSTLAFHRST